MLKLVRSGLQHINFGGIAEFSSMKASNVLMDVWFHLFVSLLLMQDPRELDFKVTQCCVSLVTVLLRAKCQKEVSLHS